MMDRRFGRQEKSLKCYEVQLMPAIYLFVGSVTTFYSTDLLRLRKLFQICINNVKIIDFLFSTSVCICAQCVL